MQWLVVNVTDNSEDGIQNLLQVTPANNLPSRLIYAPGCIRHSVSRVLFFRNTKQRPLAGLKAGSINLAEFLSNFTGLVVSHCFTTMIFSLDFFCKAKKLLAHKKDVSLTVLQSVKFTIIQPFQSLVHYKPFENPPNFTR